MTADLDAWLALSPYHALLANRVRDNEGTIVYHAILVEYAALPNGDVDYEAPKILAFGFGPTSGEAAQRALSGVSQPMRPYQPHMLRLF